MLHGVTHIRAHSTQGLTRFDLDFMLNVTKVAVGGVPASFRRGLPGRAGRPTAVRDPRGTILHHHCVILRKTGQAQVPPNQQLG